MEGAFGVALLSEGVGAEPPSSTPPPFLSLTIHSILSHPTGDVGNYLPPQAEDLDILEGF
jgi:hypothetical protein